MSLKSKSKEVLARRKLRNKAIGGFSSVVVGPPGSGKTSMCLHEACKFMEWYPDEIIFWRDSPDSVSQYNRIGNNYQILVENGLNIRFHNLDKGGDINIPFKTFNKIEDILDQDSSCGLAKPNILNVIYFKQDYSWIDLICYLRHCVGWQSIFVDEIEDIIPLNPSPRPGENRNYRMEKNLQFSNDAKHVRKGLVNLICNTQSYSEVDWRFRKKLNFMCYLRGAKVDSDSRVSQDVVDNLNLGECLVDQEHRIFGKLHFPGYPPRYPLFESVIKVN